MDSFLMRLVAKSESSLDTLNSRGHILSGQSHADVVIGMFFSGLKVEDRSPSNQVPDSA